jgi:hypothetical protein
VRDLHGVEVLRHLRGLHEPGQLQHVRVEHCQQPFLREPGLQDQVLVSRGRVVRSGGWNERGAVLYFYTFRLKQLLTEFIYSKP